MTSSEMEKAIRDLQTQVNSLLQWQEHKRTQQLELPLDLVSQTLIKNL